MPIGKLEVKTDFLSGFTGRIAIEDDTLQRDWDRLWVITLMHKIYTKDEVWHMVNDTYERKREQMGDRQDHWGTTLPIIKVKEYGKYEGQFSREVQQLTA